MLRQSTMALCDLTMLWLRSGFICGKRGSYSSCSANIPTQGSRGTCSAQNLLVHRGACTAICKTAGTKMPMRCSDKVIAQPKECCATGTEWDGQQSSSCTQCTSGTTDHDLDPLTPCALCPAGRYSNSTGSKGACRACAAGTYGTEGAPSAEYCITCAAGRFDHDGITNPNKNLSAVPDDCFADASMLGGDGSLQQDKLVATVNLPTEYTMGFDITPHASATVGALSSILHVTWSGGNQGLDGSRIPGLWFKPGKRVLYVVDGRRGSSVDSNTDTWGCTDAALTLAGGKVSAIKLTMTPYSVKIYINKVLVCQDSWPTADRRAYDGAKVYLADPWYAPARASVKNLYLIQGECSSTSASTPCRECTGGRFSNTTGDSGACHYSCPAGSFAIDYTPWKPGVHTDILPVRYTPYMHGVSYRVAISPCVWAISQGVHKDILPVRYTPYI
jgi:hypothetical protein